MLAAGVGLVMTVVLFPSLRHVSSMYDIFSSRWVHGVLLAIFGIGYIHRVLARRSINNTTLLVACVLVISIAAASIFYLAGMGSSCVGFFGVNTGCEATRLIAIIFIANLPPVLIATTVLLLAGVVSVFIPRKDALGTEQG